MTQVNILNASAGAGKTFRLVLKYICDILNKPESYRNILAVTFTNKATEEMKSRIINELHNLADNRNSDYLEEIEKNTGLSPAQIRSKAAVARTQILHNYSHFTVLTIDSFFQRILRAFIHELSLDLDYNIELDTDAILERSADDLIDTITKDENKKVKEWLLSYAMERLKGGNKWDMRKDLCSLGSELFKNDIAKSASGSVDKDTLESNVKIFEERYNNILDEIKERAQKALDILKAKKLVASDFYGKNRKFITCFNDYAKGEMDKGPDDKIIEASQNIEKWYTKDSPQEVKDAAKELQPILKKICDLYTDNIKLIHTTELLLKNYRSYALLSDLYKSIDNICKNEHIMALDKTKDILAEFIKDVNAPFIYEKVGNRFTRYMIDEFQDTSKREWDNIRPLLDEALSSNEEDSASVFIVGDIKQSIYRWRGGQWQLLNTQVKEDLKRGNPTVESLATNRRSLQNIVEFNNLFMRSVVDCDNKFINEMIDEQLNKENITEATHDEYKNIIATAYTTCEQEVHRKDEHGIAEVTIFNTSVIKESPFIEAIEDALHRGYRYKDILILVRGKSDSRKVAEQLYKYKSENNLSFNILTSDSLSIGSCDVIKFIIAVMRLAINPSDDIERGIYNGYLGYKCYGDKFSPDEEQLLSKIGHLSALEAFELIIKEFGLNVEGNATYLQAIHEQILSFSSNHIADIQHYLAWWEEHGSSESLSVEMTDNTIEITTIHKAKGLEREVVIIPYCKWDMLPAANKQNIVWSEAKESVKDAANIGKFPVNYGPMMKDSAFAEDYWKEYVMSHVDGLNLLYVAVTRAKRELYIYVPLSDKALKEETSKDKEVNYSNVSGLIYQTVKKLKEMPIQSGYNYKLEGDAPVILVNNNTDETKSKKGKKSKSDNAKTVLLRYYYGKKAESFVPKQESSNVKDIRLKEYPTHTPKVNIYRHLERFTQEGLKPGTTSCDLGIKMHKTFEGANTINDIYESIEQMVNNGYIKQTETKSLRIDIEKATSNTLVAEWFSGEWDVVKCEEEILCQGITHRPDRVMIKGDRVVVVDYKFGAVPNKDHHEQVKGYISALQNMGCYNTIEGYVWYVHLNKIEASTQE